MSVLIKGMEMPENCSDCWALDDYGDYPRCIISEEQRGYNFRVLERRMDRCPLVPVVDAVEVVRCKNCKWAVFASDGKPYGCSYLLYEKGSIYSVNGDFYCAYGARMDGRREDGDK